jgi:hypothetical protein
LLVKKTTHNATAGFNCGGKYHTFLGGVNRR